MSIVIEFTQFLLRPQSINMILFFIYLIHFIFWNILGFSYLFYKLKQVRLTHGAEKESEAFRYFWKSYFQTIVFGIVASLFVTFLGPFIGLDMSSSIPSFKNPIIAILFLNLVGLPICSPLTATWFPWELFGVPRGLRED